MTATAGEPSARGAGGSRSMPAGRVGRAHGLDGSFYVTGARPRLLAIGTVLRFAGRCAAVVRRAGTDARPIVRLDGIDGRAGAEALRGVELTVDRSDAPSLQEGEWWAGELEGCEVYDGARAVGVVIALVELPSCEALEVRLSSANAREGAAVSERAPTETILVPMVRDAIRLVDIVHRRIDVDTGFLEGV